MEGKSKKLQIYMGGGGVSEVVLQALNNKRAARKGLNIALSYKVLRVLAYRFAESFLREF